MATGLDTLVRPRALGMHPADLAFEQQFRLLEARIDGRLKVARFQDRVRAAVDVLAAVGSGLTTGRTWGATHVE